MVKVRTVKEWHDVVENPPRCCLSCRHYMGDEWSPDTVCTMHEASPPREWAEERNECEQWSELIPF